MAIKDIYDNVMNMRERNKKVYEAKYKLLQRFEASQLSDLWDKYVHVQSEVPKISEGSLTGMDIYKIAVQKGKPTSRQKMVDEIIQQTSWDMLKIYAKEHRIKFDDIVV